MKVYVNSTPVDAVRDQSLLDILTEQKLTDTRGIAVAINNVVVPKSSWPDHKLSDQDKITVIRATQGG